MAVGPSDFLIYLMHTHTLTRCVSGHMLKSLLFCALQYTKRGKCDALPFHVLAFTSEPKKEVLLLGLLLLFMRVSRAMDAFAVARCRSAITQSLARFRIIMK